MAAPRPRRALREPLAVRVLRVAAPVALVGATATGVLAYAWSPSSTQVAYPAAVAQLVPAASSARPSSARPSTAGPSSPTASRPTIDPTSSVSPSTVGDTSTTPSVTSSKTPEAEPALAVTGSRYATVDLNLRMAPQQDAKFDAELKAGSKVAITAVVRDGYRYVSVEHAGRWVKNAYLSSSKPDPATTGSISDRPCASGSQVESGLTPDAIKVHRAICARYPQVTAYGGRRGGDGFHASGRAIDNMISDSTVGWQIAKWVRAHARQLGVSQVIYSQRIWTVQRGREGWRKMGDRGSKTANHYDHVHVSVYGNRATS